VEANVNTTAIIIGGGAKAKNLDAMEFDNPHTEFWGINAIRPKWVPRWDRMFNIHKYQLLRDYGWPVDIDAQWCADNPQVPFYTADEWPDGRMTRAKIFPREEMKSMPRSDYHCNSFDWLIAAAIYWGFKEVHLHGCMLTTEGLSEQLSARACAEYWSGYAEGKGVTIVPAKDCNLFYAVHAVISERVYGYEDCPVYEDRTAGARKGAPYRYDE
jgi:hypothetical protein